LCGVGQGRFSLVQAFLITRAPRARLPTIAALSGFLRASLPTVAAVAALSGSLRASLPTVAALSGS